MKARFHVTASPGNVIRVQALADEVPVIDLSLPRALASKVVNASALNMIGAFGGPATIALVKALVAATKAVLAGAAEGEAPIPTPPAWFAP